MKMLVYKDHDGQVYVLFGKDLEEDLAIAIGDKMEVVYYGPIKAVDGVPALVEFALDDIYRMGVDVGKGA